MSSNSFSVTSSVKNKLDKIDVLYKEIMLVPVSPKIETRLRWQAMTSHLEGWSNLANQPLNRQQILEIVGQFHAKNETPQISKVLSYKNAINFVREEWTGNLSPVSFTTIQELSKILGVSNASQQVVDPLLAYIHHSNLHAVLQSALAHLAFYPNRICYILSLLYLSKAGLDLRGWLSLEDCWQENRDSYQKTIEQATATKDATAWLEYYCQGLLVQMTSVKENLTKLTSSPSVDPLKNLSPRHKAILEFIEQSPTPVTNRQIQQLFKVSQITASRDLARLSLAGLLASHGSGRATAYTKI